MCKSKYFHALLLISALLLIPVCGCKPIEATQETLFATIEIMVPLVTPEPTGSQAMPTQAPALPPAEQFSQLDKAYFTRLVTGDYYSFHNFVSDPASFDIDISSVPQTWGKLSEEQFREDAAFDASALEVLHAIDREQLSEREQMSYDVLEQALISNAAKSKYGYYYEPLSPMSGVHSTLPILLGIYPLKTRADIEAYLALLTDVPRYLSEVLTYEQEKAASGLFMTKNTLDTVETQLDQIISERKNFYLIATFNDALADIKELSAADKTNYQQMNKTLVEKNFIDAYSVLRAGLETLRSECRSEEGLYALGDDGLGYFAAVLNSEGSCDLTPNEALTLLEDEMYNLTVAGSLLRMEHPEAAEDIEKRITTGDTASDIAYLKELTIGLIGPLPEHTLMLTEIPEELEDQSSPASYLKPSFDNWNDNTVLINSAEIDETFLTVLAHEIYPGHLSQFLLQRSNAELSLSQRALNLPGYVEGWAQTAEKLMIETQGLFSRDALLYQHDKRMVFQILMPALVSIRVNYLGEGLDEIEQYLSTYNVGELAEPYYRLAIIAPYYYLSYAIGYCEFAESYRGAENDLGAAFDQHAYLKKYLDLGPGQYHVLRERMDIWVDEQVSD